MANQITSDRRANAPVRLSNSLTSVLFDVLAIAGCDLAQTPWQRRFAYWLVEHDQVRCGLGCAGFDVAELGWTVDDFAQQQQFVLAVIDAAYTRHGWQRLPFSPNRPALVEAALLALRALVSDYSPRDIAPLPDRAWVPSQDPDYGQCEVHQIYLHETGCLLCNDTRVDAPAEAAPHRSAPDE